MVDVSNKAKINWHGKWVWANYVTARTSTFADRHSEYRPLGREDMNIYILARKSFSLPQKPQKAILNITADSRYKVFLNGKYIGRGINRCESYYWYYDSYDITDTLQEGDNVVAIHAIFFGMECAFYTPPELAGRNKENCGKGGLLFELGFAYDSEEFTEWIGSDQTTRIIRNVAERSDVPLKNDAMGFIEEFDSRKMPQNWNELDFDDSSWESALIQDYPIKTLLKDDNSPLDEEIVFASKILEIGEVPDINFSPDYDEKDLAEMDFCVQHMLEDPPKPLESLIVDGQELFLGQAPVCEITPQSEGKALSILLQFPREVVGRPRIVIDGSPGTIVDVIPAEKCYDNRIAVALMTAKRGFRLILRGGKQMFEQWNWEGFLFTQIKIRCITGPIKIYHYSTNNTHMRIEKHGQFVSDSDAINRLWEACALTLKCCAIDGYLDCPSREQRSYLGDAYPEAMVATACFGEPRLTKKIIYDTAFGQRKDGITFSFHPGDYQQQCHIIPDYCFYWIQIAYQYWWYYGDDQALFDLYPHFVKAIDWFWNYFEPEKSLLGDKIPYWLFIDWSFGHDKLGYNAILNTQFMDVLRIVAEIGKKYGDMRTVTKYQTIIEKMCNAIDTTFWDEEHGYYHDYLKDGVLSDQISLQTNAYLVIKGVAPQEKWASILTNVFETPEGRPSGSTMQELQKQNHHSIKKPGQIVFAQPFFMHHVNQYFAKMGRFDLMWEYFETGWLPMLTIGETGTIWETWSQEGSECHAWSATPAYDLSTFWLGVKPLEAGFKSVEVSPTFECLNQVHGIFPSIKGDILVEWIKSQNNGTVHVELAIQIPDQINGGICRIMPLAGKFPTNIITENLTNENNTNIESSFVLNTGPNHFAIEY